MWNFFSFCSAVSSSGHKGNHKLWRWNPVNQLVSCSRGDNVHCHSWRAEWRHATLLHIVCYRVRHRRTAVWRDVHPACDSRGSDLQQLREWRDHHKDRYPSWNAPEAFYVLQGKLHFWFSCSQWRAFQRISKPIWSAAAMWRSCRGTTAPAGSSTPWRRWAPADTCPCAGRLITIAIWRTCGVESFTTPQWPPRTYTARANPATAWRSRLVWPQKIWIHSNVG